MYDERDFNKKMGEAIRRLRTNKKYSIEKLAEYSDTDYSSVSQIENGKQSPKSYTLYKILHALDINSMDAIVAKAKARTTLEDSVINKIRLMNKDGLLALFSFLEKFTLLKK